MPGEGTQKKLTRIRPPSVQVSYDLPVGDAIERKELPFSRGVAGESDGQPEQPVANFCDRRFVDINPDNFGSIFDNMRPQLSFDNSSRIEDGSSGECKPGTAFRHLDLDQLTESAQPKDGVQPHEDNAEGKKFTE